MRKISIELKKCLLSKYTIGTILLVTIICMLSQGYQTDKGVTYSILSLFLRATNRYLRQSIEMSSTMICRSGIDKWSFILFPVVLGLSFISCINDEKKNGAIKYNLIRENRLSFCVSKTIACMVTGGITLLLGYILFAALVYIRFPSIYSYSDMIDSGYLEILGIDLSWKYYLTRLVSVFLYGAISNVFVYGVTIFFTDGYVIMCFPIMLSYIYASVLDKIQKMNMEAYNTIELFDMKNTLDNPFIIKKMFTVGLFLSIYVILTFIYANRLKKSEVNSYE